MKIAIVAPCPVPYMVGGAEKLWWGLAAHLNEDTPHQAEIIKLPSPEHDLASLIRSYRAFSTLDLGAFDVVISGKYPAWMVSHPRHVCYMLHRLRGLYDSYPGVAEIPREIAAHPDVRTLLDFMRRYPERAALEEFFGRWMELVGKWNRPAGLLDFPGPVARELVHWLDAIALAPGAITRYAAISATVAGRPGYFPEGVEVAVAHPPPHRAMAPGNRFEHFYTVGRLDGPKRVDLVIEAFRQVRTTMPLIIGGTGPEESRLRELARKDPRIRFAGFQSDAEVRDHYQRALAVPFVPYEEDYGLIAIEAMQSGKPVVTSRDAGGACELVEDGMTGFVCEPTPGALAAALQKLADDPGLARSMGAKGVERGAAVSWPAVSRTLLAASQAPVARPAAKRRKLLLASTFPIHPPRHGGQSRIYHLYRALAPEFETVIVSLCRSAEPAFDGEIAPGLREVRIPISEEHERREHAMQKKVGTPVTDVMMPRLHGYTPRLGETLRREAADADAAIASHPYLYPALAELGIPIWYEAHNLELHLKTALFAKLPHGDGLIDAVRAVEAASVHAAQVILCASPDDAQALVKEFGANPAAIVDVPNGTDALRIRFVPPAERAEVASHMGLAETPVVLFMGSGHWPNIEAVKRVFEFASALPRLAFAILGSVCYAFDHRLAPPNVMFVGEVDDITRNLFFEASSVGLNPMEHGSGTNLKMLDFFAAGLPVIATERGSRGLRLDGEAQCLIRSVEEFPPAIEEVLGAGATAAAARSRAARELVEREFDWGAIARRIKPRLMEAVDGAARRPFAAAPRARHAGTRRS